MRRALRPSALLAAHLVLAGAASAQEVGPGAEPDPPRAPETVVTATRHESELLDVPQSISVIDETELRSGPGARSLPDALLREPGVLLQKTGPGQSSPFIRGFTGFRTLLMIDGIRLNNSVFREGPNQYLSTVDAYSIDHVELLRGPSSSLWGSDAIGGAVNAITAKSEVLDDWAGRWVMRWSSAERALFNRVEFETGQTGVYALKGGISDKDYGDIRAGDGTGNQPGTSFDEQDFDARLDLPQGDGAQLTFVAQRVRQDNVPRTHTTIDAIPFEGTAPGTELFRDLDQQRDLVYGRLTWDHDGGLYDEGRVTLSWQRQQELQQRLRTGGKYDESGFDVATTGLQIEFESDTGGGLLTWGVEGYHDSVDSFRNDSTNGTLTLANIQGPVGDDASYDTLGLFVQDELVSGPWETTLGLRWSRASARAERVDNPNVPGADPATPGNILAVDEHWQALTGSTRVLRRLGEGLNVFAGLAQGFRAPNLSDLTSELTDSGIESPTPDLDPEHYLQFEVGAKLERDAWNGELVLFHTWVRDMIVRSPTGQFLGGLPVLVKSNVGDGRLYGVEARAAWEASREVTAFASATWNDGLVDQFDPAGNEVSEPFDRTLPLTLVLGATWRPADCAWWWQADTLIAAKADKLSLKDQTDLQRIPPGGTPSYGVLGLRAGRALSPTTTLTVALENLLDENYRIHGSGVNEPGRSLVLSLDVRF